MVGKRVVKVDGCMVNIIDFINSHPNITTLASCCGHGIYDMSIVIKHSVHNAWEITDLISGQDIPREKRFYKTDSEGRYYIPEAVERRLKRIVG